MLFVLYQFSGMFSLLYYAPQMFSHAGLGSELPGLTSAQTLLLYSSIVTIFILITMALSSPAVDRCGRRYMLLRFLPGAGCSMLLLALTYGLEELGYEWVKWVSMAAVFLFVCSFGFSLSLVYLINAEIFPLHLRTTANTITGSVNWTCLLIVNLSFLSLSDSIAGKVGHPQ